MATSSPNLKLEYHAKRRAHYLAGLIWHLGAFVIINASFWLMDLVVGQDGFQWAYWITAGWSFGLALHALAYLVDGSQLEERQIHKYLEREEREKALV